ncbi:GAF and ANTAR domain-containing protein [Mycolicibacterium sp. S2-37]|uniref:GAF and ANTAR domain-containing protein n=1 Tax=Mycolicibacterium sp. S2-37 TaxID=2810297 RepID=UPI001A9437D0|nr:GAF and ANTAR domain-containing protein [Mycolicibacterium sp. S2-37]MBO0678384.1 GAF and ANTAR domain-containing protein [Mycolicibacterium sp. S2-37]
MSQHSPVHLRLAELVRDLSSENAGNVDTVLSDLTRVAVEYIPGTSAAGMTVIERRRNVRTLGATDPIAKILDEIQQRHSEGPCLSAAWMHPMVRIDDLTHDRRWPLFRRDALAETPLRASLSFMMFTNRASMGALNLYADTPHAFDDDASELGLVFATHSAALWSVILRDDQFRSALASRDIIGQAKGILMERFGIDATRAFDLMTTLSQESNTKVVDVAQRVVETEPGA